MGEHRCHAQGCKAAVPRRMLMCKRHWYMVPKDIRDEVNMCYRPGQCDDKRPSKEWFAAARAAILYVLNAESTRLGDPGDGRR